MKHENLIPMNLQHFAEGGDQGGDGGSTDAQGGSNAGGVAGQQGSNAPQIDYEKIQQMLNGTLQAKEDTALKAYFKQQGLSQQEAEQAMATFKAEKAKNTPDANALQNQLTESQAELQAEKVNNAATMAAFGLGIDAKTIPYVLKLADLSGAIGADGKISNDNLTAALKKVLEDVPGVKTTGQQGSGFQFGANNSSDQANKTTDEKLELKNSEDIIHPRGKCIISSLFFWSFFLNCSLSSPNGRN